MAHYKHAHLSSNQQPEKKYASRIVRRTVSIAPVIGLVAPSARPLGISMCMRVKNNAEWIKPSVESVMGMADEIVIVDNGSTDGTYDILKELASAQKGLIKLHRCPELKFCDLSNFTLNKTSFRWAFKWDGDMVAHTSGEYNISHLRKRLFSLNEQRYYIIYLRYINLAGDLFHQDPNEMVHIEEYIHTASKKARYIQPGRFEAVKFPKYYTPFYWYEPYCFHINIKSNEGMLLRYYWEDWNELKDYTAYPTPEDYGRSRIEMDFKTTSWEKAKQRYARNLFRDYIKFNPEKLSPYPELLKPYLNAPKYRLKYENGKIVGRDES